MTNIREEITHLLNNQPGGIRIGCSRGRTDDIENTPFHHLCRLDQIDQLMQMIMCGVGIVELQKELYLVCYKPTYKVWTDFGLPYMCSGESSSSSEESSSDSIDKILDNNNAPDI